jgi:3-oxoacyl-[acyl-carrier protein] reductase
MYLKGKKALVTGGDRGIGRAIVLALAEKRCHTAVHYFKNEDAAEEVLTKLKKFSIQSVKVQADIREFDEVKRMMEKVRQVLGGIDIIVNNAGVSGPNSKIEHIDREEWQWVIDVNLLGVFNCCKAALSDLREGKGKIVNISSIAGKMGGTLGSHYAAAKAGVIGLTFALARELAPEVTVNAVAPGPVDTDLLTPEAKLRLAKQTPFGRIAAPEEIAHTVIFLLENNYVSGEVVDVNAGRHMD